MYEGFCLGRHFLAGENRVGKAWSRIHYTSEPILDAAFFRRTTTAACHLDRVKKKARIG